MYTMHINYDCKQEVINRPDGYDLSFDQIQKVLGQCICYNSWFMQLIRAIIIIISTLNYELIIFVFISFLKIV